MSSKLSSLIGKSTSDYEQQKKKQDQFVTGCNNRRSTGLYV